MSAGTDFAQLTFAKGAIHIWHLHEGGVDQS